MPKGELFSAVLVVVAIVFLVSVMNSVGTPTGNVAKDTEPLTFWEKLFGKISGQDRAEQQLDAEPTDTIEDHPAIQDPPRQTSGDSCCDDASKDIDQLYTDFYRLEDKVDSNADRLTQMNDNLNKGPDCITRRAAGSDSCNDACNTFSRHCLFGFAQLTDNKFVESITNRFVDCPSRKSDTFNQGTLTVWTLDCVCCY